MGTERIPDFWRWWTSTGRDAVTAAVRGTDHARLNELLQRRGLDFDKSLTFDVRRGTTSEYRLSLSSGGAVRGRVVAERWLRAGPSADGVWQYAAARPADRKVLAREHTFSRYTVRTGDATIVWSDGADGRLDVELLHPRLPSVPPGPKATILDKILDGLVGEDEAMRHIGARTSGHPRDDGRPLTEFAAVVAERDAARTPDERWRHVTGEAVSGRILASPLWIDLPLLDHLTRLTFVTDEAADAAQQELSGELGHRIRLVTRASMHDHTVLFLYTDSADIALTAWLTQWAADHEPANVAMYANPGWTAAYHLRGPSMGVHGEDDYTEDGLDSDGGGD